MEATWGMLRISSSNVATAYTWSPSFIADSASTIASDDIAEAVNTITALLPLMTCSDCRSSSMEGYKSKVSSLDEEGSPNTFR